MTIKVTEVGKLFTYATYFDLSAATDLELYFTMSDGSTLTVENARITAPAVPYNDPVLGTLAASTYMQFTTEADDFTVSGVTHVYGKYESLTQTFYGDCATFTVAAKTCT